MYLRYVNFYFFEEILYRIFLGKIMMSRFRFLHIEESKISRKSSVDSKISNSSLKIQAAEISYIFRSV